MAKTGGGFATPESIIRGLSSRNPRRRSLADATARSFVNRVFSGARYLGRSGGLTRTQQRKINSILREGNRGVMQSGSFSTQGGLAGDVRRAGRILNIIQPPN